MTPFLSIVIPAYRVEAYIETCLNSVIQDPLAADGRIEVIVVDDGSPDNSGRIADDFAAKYAFIRVIHKKNAGVAAARNTGIDAATGEWLYFMDSDDWLADRGLTAILRRCRDNSDADMLLFDAWQNSEKGESVWEHFPRACVWTEKKDIRRLQRGVLYYPCAYKNTRVPLAAPWDKVYKTSFVRRNHLYFQEQLQVLDDMIFNMEALGWAKKVAYCKDRIYHYRYVSASITNSYKPARVNNDRLVWQYLQAYMTNQWALGGWTEAEQEAFRQAYYCRVIKSFSICCRLSFFNSRNRKNIFSKISFVRAVTWEDTYCQAFRDVKLKNAEWKLKIMILVGRMHSGVSIYLLHLAQSLAG